MPRFGKFGYTPDPPDVEECGPENWGEAMCYFCINDEYCKKLYEEHEREVQDERTREN